MPNAEDPDLKGPWEARWHVEPVTADDVEMAAKDGRKLVEGEPLWRIVKAIGPLEAEHNHWGGCHLVATASVLRAVKSVPEMIAALRYYATLDPLGGKARDILAYIETPEPEPVDPDDISDFL